MLNEQENKTSGFVVPTSAIYPCVFCFRLLQPALQRAFRPKRLPTQSAALQSCTTCWHQTCTTCPSMRWHASTRPVSGSFALRVSAPFSHSPPRSTLLVLAGAKTFQTQLTAAQGAAAHRHTTPRAVSTASCPLCCPCVPRVLAPHHMLVHLRCTLNLRPRSKLSTGRCKDHDMRCSSTSRLRSQQSMAG